MFLCCLFMLGDLRGIVCLFYGFCGCVVVFLWVLRILLVFCVFVDLIAFSWVCQGVCGFLCFCVCLWIYVFCGFVLDCL